MSAKAPTKSKLLQDELEGLRAALGMEPISVDDWEASIPQHLRDRYAAEAFFFARGQLQYALRRLGIIYEGKLKATAARVFDTPGCKALIDADLADAEANRPEIVARLVQIARFGHDDTAVRAAMVIGKMAGWEKPQEHNHNVSGVLSIFQQLGMQSVETQAALPKAVDTIEGFLAHEPGDAVRVSSDDDIDAILEEEAV